MVIAADYPFLDIFWTMLLFFAWVAWIWMLVIIVTDVFRRRDIGGWGKAAWTVCLVVVPFLGVLAYLVAEHDGMAERSERQAQANREQLDSYVRSVAAEGGPASEIEKAKSLLDSGTITQQDYESIKTKALA
jgi:Phospholipase_D-nuclease N-terminal